MVTFQPTETSLIVMVPILIDIRLEGVEQFTAMLSLPAGQVGVVLGADMATVEITDDDQPYSQCRTHHLPSQSGSNPAHPR